MVSSSEIRVNKRLELPWLSSGLRPYPSNAGGMGSIPGQGTRSHIWQLKIPHAATKIHCSQINTYFLKALKKRVNKRQGSYLLESDVSVVEGSLN